MSRKISSAEYPLEELFSSEFSFNIPCYQPPYVWGEGPVTRLFDDLYDAFLLGQEDIYFLGCIVLIKSDWYPDADVLDGQQRLTTLTIFLAALAEELAGERRVEFQNYICQPACGGQVPKPRLRLQEHDRSFFFDHVQADQLDLLLSYTPAQLKRESRINIQGCARVLRERLRNSFGNDADKLGAFGSFLMKRCFLIVMSTPTLISSAAILAVQNSRRRDHFSTHVIKSAMAPTNQIVIKLVYDHLREIYIHEDSGLDLTPDPVEYVIELSSLAGVRHTDGSCHIGDGPPSFDRREFSSIYENDLKMVFGPARTCAGTIGHDEDGDMKWGEGEPLFLGHPRFTIDKSEIIGAFPFGFWGFEWEAHLDYVMIEEGLLRKLTEKAIGSGAMISAWRIEFGGECESKPEHRQYNFARS